MSDPKLDAARRNAEFARERLLNDAHLLQARLAPAALAAEAKLTVRSKASDAVEAARARPAVAAGAAAGVFAFLVRKPAFRLAKRLFKSKKADAAAATIGEAA